MDDKLGVTGWSNVNAICISHSTRQWGAALPCLRSGAVSSDYLANKYIDDTTLTELIPRPATSRMQLVVDDLVFQASQCHMNINEKKTKEMLTGQLRRNAPPSLMLEDGTEVERVTVFTLLGVHISDNMNWAQHVNALASKVASGLYFLKQLNRSGASTEDLLCFLYLGHRNSTWIRLSCTAF